MKPQTVYTVVDKEKGLPKKEGYYLSAETGKEDIHWFSGINNQFESGSLRHLKLTHYLKEQPDRYVFSREELVELLSNAYTNGLTLPVPDSDDESIFIKGLDDYLKSKNLAEW